MLLSTLFLFRLQLLKLRSRLVYWWSQTYHPSPTSTTEKLGGLLALEPRLFANWERYSACQINLTVVYPTLGQYTKALVQARDYVVRGQGIPRNWCSYEFEPATLESLFIDNGKQRLYLDPLSEVSAFKNAVSDFYAHYKAPHWSLDATQAHNARIFSNFEPHLLGLIKELMLYSQR